MALHRAIIDLDDFTESKNIMIYADTGAGKTMLTAGLLGKVLIISSENGTIVIKKWLERYGNLKDAKRFKMWVIRKWNDLEEAYVWCRENPGVFDWLVIDSATSVEMRAMRAAMEKAVARSPQTRDIDLPDRGEHQKMQNAMKRMITDFNELPTNVLWYAQAMHREDRDGNEIVLPFIMGKDYEVSAWACAQMQAFGYYRKVPRKVGDLTLTARELLFDSYVDGKSEVEYWAKDRYGVLPRKVTIAIGDEQKGTLGQLFALIESDPNAIKRAQTRVDERDDDDDSFGKQPDRNEYIGSINNNQLADENADDPPFDTDDDDAADEVDTGVENAPVVAPRKAAAARPIRVPSRGGPARPVAAKKVAVKFRPTTRS